MMIPKTRFYTTSAPYTPLVRFLRVLTRLRLGQWAWRKERLVGALSIRKFEQERGRYRCARKTPSNLHCASSRWADGMYILLALDVSVISLLIIIRMGVMVELHKSTYNVKRPHSLLPLKITISSTSTSPQGI